LLAAVALTTTCSAKESVKNQVRQAVTLGSVALAAGLGLLAIHLGIAVQGWLVFFGLALLAVGYISMPYRTKWAPAISVGAQLTILGVGMYLIALQ
ncbi:MAG: hypothetical protein Q8P77_03110, partial [Candidatus Veblenbacteria bacterium]|nr:hypothetical protein [Candidatus Veblenbacteria bacterium]